MPGGGTGWTGYRTLPAVQPVTIKIEKLDGINFILGQTHFINSVEDIHEALVATVPGTKFGLAFCEAFCKCLVRWPGTDPDMLGDSTRLLIDDGEADAQQL